jgi:cell division protease FtsH
MRQMQGGGRGGAFSFGKSKAKILDESNNTVTFADVAGCDEAKEEVAEIVEFLRDPSKFQKLGGRIPRGVLMVGSPGTGKTLLAKAIAGEAKVPFFSISGSDFVEMFVGVGAARVRDMFEQAKKNAPCIVFIDEIDAVGRQRGAGLGGGNDEREQTLNQLLVEMDGFEGNAGVIVIAATNRPDVLDPALMRPGRFDRQVVVPLPDIRGREQILLVHMRKVPMASDVKAEIIARGTPGFSGADLANLVNEAALFAARKNKRLVDMDDFEMAKDKIVMGAERRSIVMPEEERRNTAYHESGHAIVAKLLPKTDPVHKVTIIPRGRALGVTMQLPEQDRYSMGREYMLNAIAVLFGGRISEELFMNQMTTGASNDFERATHIARDMVTRYGMSDLLGPMVYGENEGEVFLGRSITRTVNMSEETMRKVDAEIRKIIDQQYAVARQLLEDNRDKVEAMAHALLELETIDADQIDDIMAGRPPRPPKPTPNPGAPTPGSSAGAGAAPSANPA